MATNPEAASNEAPASAPAETPSANNSTTNTGRNAANKQKLEVKILMLHGYAQTGPLFRSKTGAMSKMMAKALPTITATRIYPTGPYKLQPADIPGFTPRAGGADGSVAAEPDAHGWFLHDEAPGLLRGLDEGLRAIADAVQDAGGVDGVLGFSQGGAVAALVAAALETGRPLPAREGEGGLHRGWVERLRAANGGRPLKFCVVYSGYVARPGAQLGWLYQGGITTPSCHFLGSMDTVVEEPRCQALAECFVGPDIFVHPGGHHVPMRKEWVGPLLGFLRKVLEDDKAPSTGRLPAA